MAVSSQGRSGTSIIELAAICSLIQSVIWLVLALCAILLKECVIVIDPSNSAYVLAVLYFHNAECSTYAFSSMGWTVETRRTYVMAWWFFLVSVFRVVICLRLLTAIRRAKATGSCIEPKRFRNWAWYSGASLLSDFICAMIYASDITDAKELQMLLEKILSSYILDRYWDIQSASILMMLACWRFVVLWFAEGILLAKAICSNHNDQQAATGQGAVSGPGTTGWAHGQQRSQGSTPWIHGQPPSYDSNQGTPGQPPPYDSTQGTPGQPPPYGSTQGTPGQPPPYGSTQGTPGQPPPYGSTP